MGIRTYFESKIGVTVSRIWSFVPSLSAKITLKKRPDLNFFEFPGEERLRKNIVPYVVTLIRSLRPSRTCMYAPNTSRLSKLWRHFLELKGQHTARFRQYWISIQSVEVRINAKKDRMSEENETLAETS